MSAEILPCSRKNATSSLARSTSSSVNPRPPKSIWVTRSAASAGSIWMAAAIAVAARSGSEFTIADASEITLNTLPAVSSFAANQLSEADDPLRVLGAEVAGRGNNASTGIDTLRHPGVEGQEAVDVTARQQSRLFGRACAHECDRRGVDAETGQVLVREVETDAGEDAHGLDRLRFDAVPQYNLEVPVGFLKYAQRPQARIGGHDGQCRRVGIAGEFRGSGYDVLGAGCPAFGLDDLDVEAGGLEHALVVGDENRGVRRVYTYRDP